MEYIVDHSGMGSSGISSITQTNESENRDPRPQPPTPPSEVLSSEMLDRAVGATFTGPTGEVSNESSRPARPEHLPFHHEGWVGRDKADPSWAFEAIASTQHGHGKISHSTIPEQAADHMQWCDPPIPDQPNRS